MLEALKWEDSMLNGVLSRIAEVPVCATVCLRPPPQKKVKFPPCFPLNTSYCDRGFQHLKGFIEICHIMSDENNSRIDKQSLSWKLLFRVCNNVFLIRQIELLSFPLTAYNKQTNSLCILSDKAIYFLSGKTRNTHSGNWTTNEEWKIQTSSPIHHHLYKT